MHFISFLVQTLYYAIPIKRVGNLMLSFMDFNSHQFKHMVNGRGLWVVLGFIVIDCLDLSINMVECLTIKIVKENSVNGKLLCNG